MVKIFSASSPQVNSLNCPSAKKQPVRSFLVGQRGPIAFNRSAKCLPIIPSGNNERHGIGQRSRFLWPPAPESRRQIFQSRPRGGSQGTSRSYYPNGYVNSVSYTHLT